MYMNNLRLENAIKKIKELHLQFRVIIAAIEKIAQMTGQDLKTEGSPIFTINKWALNNKVAIEKIMIKNNINF